MASDNWETISDWINVLVPLRSKYQLGAAATTSAPSGLEWVLVSSTRARPLAPADAQS